LHERGSDFTKMHVDDVHAAPAHQGLSPTNFKGCCQGNFLLDEEEKRWVQEALSRINLTRKVTEFDGARLVLESEVPALIASEGSEIKTAEWLSSRSRSRSRSPLQKLRKSPKLPSQEASATQHGADQSSNHSQSGGSTSSSALTCEATKLSKDLLNQTPGARSKVSEQWPPPPESLEVIEVESREEQEAAVALHLSKNTFHEERELVRFRIHQGDCCACRTWILTTSRSCSAPPSPTDSTASLHDAGGSVSSGCSTGRGRRSRGRGMANESTKPACNARTPITCLAAATVRINEYANEEGRRWGQILNMSTRRERQGLGTALIAGLEELLRQEDFKVLILYPAENGRAPAFWSSLGYGSRARSLLPSEELIPHDQGGPLFPEFDPGSRTELPRWEKLLIAGSPHGVLEEEVAESAGNQLARGRHGRALRRQLGRGRARRSNIASRARPAAASRLWGEPLRAAVDALKDHRARLKADVKFVAAEGVPAPAH